MLIIGIAGGTGSGKTTVVKKIIESLPPGEVVLLPQDSYYKDNSHVPVEKRQYINFDHPDAFDWPLLSEQVTLLKEGKCIEQPTYSYLTCCRLPETIHIEPRDVVIIEGILALCDPQLRDLMDLKVFVDTDSDERLIRVIQRDMIERGRTAEAVMERYTRVLKPMHLQFIEPSKRYADLIIPEGGSNQIAINILKGNYIRLCTISKIIKGHMIMYPFIIQSFFSFFFPFPSFLTLQERVFRKRGSRGSIFGL